MPFNMPLSYRKMDRVQAKTGSFVIIEKGREIRGNRKWAIVPDVLLPGIGPVAGPAPDYRGDQEL